MRETVIRCDHCGNVIDGDPYKVYVDQVDKETGMMSVAISDQNGVLYDKIADLDWCENCHKNLVRFLLDTSHLLLARPPVRYYPSRETDEEIE